MRGERKFTARDRIKLEEIFGKPADYLLERDNNVEIGKPPSTGLGHGSFKNLLHEMETQGITHHKLSELLGFIEATVYMKLRGERKFTAKDKIKLEEIFGKPADYLLEYDDD